MGHLKEFGKSAHILMGLLMVAVMVGCVALSVALYRGSFTSRAGVTLYADRAGLVLEKGSDVKFNGVVVGRVEDVQAQRDRARIDLEVDTDALHLIPANVTAAIDPTTLLGRKFITLERPAEPAAARLADGAVIDGAEISTEVNDLLASLTEVVEKISPRKVSDAMNALAVALHGVGDNVGTLIEDLDGYLRRFNPLLPTLRRDIALSVPAVDRINALAPDALSAVKNLTVTGRTLTEKEEQFTAFLMSFGGFGNAGREFFEAGGRPLKESLASLRAPLSTVGDFAGIMPCFVKNLAQTSRYLELTNGGSDLPGLNVVGALLMGNPPYTYPQNLPKVGMSGVSPSCHESSDGTPEHIDFPDGSGAYRPIVTPLDMIGNPLADLMSGGNR